MAEEEITHPTIAQRAQSGNHKKSMMNIQLQNQPIQFGNSFAKEVNSISIKETIFSL